MAFCGFVIVDGQSLFEKWKSGNTFDDRWEGIDSPENVSGGRIDVVGFHRSRELQVTGPKALTIEFEGSTQPVEVVVREEQLAKAYYMLAKPGLPKFGNKYRFTWPTASVITPKGVQVSHLVALVTLAAAKTGKPGRPMQVAPVDFFADNSPPARRASSSYELFAQMDASASGGTWSVFDRCVGGAERASGIVGPRAGGSPFGITLSLPAGWTGEAGLKLTFSRVDREGDMIGELCFTTQL